MKIKASLVLLTLALFCPALPAAQQGRKLPTIKEAMELDHQGKHGEAVEAINRIIVEGSAAAKLQAYLSLGLVYFRDGDYDNAVDGFSRALEMSKTNPMANYFLGMIYEKKALGTPSAEVSKDMKMKALKCWQDYMANVGTTKIPDVHRNIGISVKEGIKRAKKHVEILKKGLGYE